MKIVNVHNQSQSASPICWNCGKRKLVIRDTIAKSYNCKIWPESLAVDIAAGSGNLMTVKNLCENFRRLLDKPDPCGLTIPFVRASNAGNRKVNTSYLYLFDRTFLEVMMHDGWYWATCLLLDGIFYGFLGKSYMSTCTPHALVSSLVRSRCLPLNVRNSSRGLVLGT